MTRSTLRSILVLVGSLLFYPACSLLLLDGLDLDSPLPSTLVCVVEDSLAAPLAPSLSQYQADLAKEGIAFSLHRFPGGGTVQELKAFLADKIPAESSLLLVGELPAAFYEQPDGDGREETFPCELYLSNPNVTWTDADQDGIYDGHGPLSVAYPVSRLNGTAAELAGYFGKVHTYRAQGSRAINRSFIFKDDDWSDFRSYDAFNLNLLFTQVEMFETSNQTRRADYYATSRGNSYGYVYQWIHANPSTLFVETNKDYERINTADLAANQPRGQFYNLFDCKAARFTENNLGMTYLTQTQTGLAVTGSTKVGGNHNANDFNRALAGGASWGYAFKAWYNKCGSSDDAWFLGMVILGDPTLRLTTLDSSRELSRDLSNLVPPDESRLGELMDNLNSFAAELESPPAP